MAGAFSAIYQQSIDDPETFWADAAKAIDWIEPPTKILDRADDTAPGWYANGVLNTCYNCLDRHVEQGRGAQTAVIYDSPVTDTIQHISYQDLLDQVAAFAGALAGQGVKQGDRVILYMPMIPQALVAMLACARIGAIHSVVFGGFAPQELATRIDDAQPVCIVTASCGIEGAKVLAYKPMIDEAINLSKHKPSSCIIYARPQAEATMIPGRDIDWHEAVAASEPAACVPVKSSDPLYILYTSGTTGQPKGVVRDNGGHAVALYWSMKNIYGVDPGEVFWAASDVGWVVGHSYICYGPLLHGNTTILFEGKPVGTPDAGTFWRVISEHKCAAMFTAPTAFRAIRKEDPDATLLKQYDLSAMRTLFLAGERCDPDTLHWAEDTLNMPVIDHWWQTETGWSIAANCTGIELLPVKPGSPARPVPGYVVHVLDEEGQQLPAGEIGAISIKLPMPPSCLPTLWQNHERFLDSYMSRYEGYYLTGDAGYIDEDGYLYIMSRIDDVINVAGHRLSTGAMEEVIAGHPDIAECAVFGAADDLKGQLPVGVVVLKSGVDRQDSDIVAELVARVRAEIGPVAAFKRAHVVKRLPKTRSGKILRGTMQKIADGETYKMPATIDDPVILDEIKTAFGQ